MITITRPRSSRRCATPRLKSTVTMAAAEGATSTTPFWNSRSGIFDGPQLRLAIVIRGWTVREFAAVSDVSLASLYNALAGRGVTDRTAIRVFRGLALRAPIL